MEHVNCLRCGACCYLIIDGQISNKKCKHLVKTSKGKTLCRVYKTRLGRDLGHGNHCDDRLDHNFEHPNCPLNGGKQNE